MLACSVTIVRIGKLGLCEDRITIKAGYHLYLPSRKQNFCIKCNSSKKKMDALALKPESIDMVIYHRDCSDGFCAAWAAHRKLGDKAIYLAAKHGDTPPDVRGRRVVIVDFAWDLPTMLKLIFMAKQLAVIDHHKSAKDALNGKMPPHTTWFEMEQSAATMAWTYFFPSTPPPPFIAYVQDRDLWRFSNEESRAYCAFLDTLPLQFDSYDAQAEEAVFRRSIVAGLVSCAQRPPFLFSLTFCLQIMLEYQTVQISEALEHSCERKLRGHRVREANSTSTFIFATPFDHFC